MGRMWRFARTLGWAVIAVAFCCILADCGSVVPLMPAAHSHVSSFLGVSFGESLSDLEMKYPGGEEETSPYGAPAYRIDDVSGDDVHYRKVVYEFAEGTGMQMVYAEFDPISAAELFKDLKNSLGEPVSAWTESGKAHDAIDAEWLLPEGELVKYDSGMNRLAILGPSGGSLRADIRMRDEMTS